MCPKSIQSCPTLCDPVDYSLPGSSVHGDSPGKKLEVGCRVPIRLGINVCICMLNAVSIIVGKNSNLKIIWNGIKCK